jgi:crossover junction endodeoxyribonuclease RusA
MVEQDKSLDSWRTNVGNVAKLMLPDNWETQGIFVLKVLFYLPRPKIHYSVSGQIKPNAPVFHAQRKDYDKLLRAIGDSLTGICYQDDSMIVSGSAMKFYTPQDRESGAWISVARLGEEKASRLALELLP